MCSTSEDAEYGFVLVDASACGVAVRSFGEVASVVVTGALVAVGDAR